MKRGQLLPIFLALGLFLGTVLAAALGLVYLSDLDQQAAETAQRGTREASRVLDGLPTADVEPDIAPATEAEHDPFPAPPTDPIVTAAGQEHGQPGIVGRDPDVPLGAPSSAAPPPLPPTASAGMTPPEPIVSVPDIAVSFPKVVELSSSAAGAGTTETPAPAVSIQKFVVSLPGLSETNSSVAAAEQPAAPPPPSEVSALIVSVPEITLSFPALEELGSGTAQAASPGIPGASGGPILVVNAPDTGPILPLPAESGADGVARLARTTALVPEAAVALPSPSLIEPAFSRSSDALAGAVPDAPVVLPAAPSHAPVVASAVPDWLLAVAPGTAAKAMPPPATAAAPADERSARTATLGPPPVRRATSPRPAPVAGPADTAGSPGRPPTAARPVRPRAVGEAVPSPQTRPNGIPPARQAGRIARPSPEPAGEPLDLARVASGMAATPRLGQSPRRLDFRADAIDLPPSLRPTGQP